MSFADFPEQQQVVALLQRSLERQRLAHAYLFTGGSLPELEAVARTLAKVVNCQNPRRGENQAAIDSCDTCLSCRQIDQGTHPDIRWTRPESKMRTIRIDQIRDLIQAVNLTPTEATYKFGILIAADRLTVEAANCFLKTLEEPPVRSILILLSTDPLRLMETILSRCLRLNFAGESSTAIAPADADWLTTTFQNLSAQSGGRMNRYWLLGEILARLNTAKEAITANLEASSPLERHDEIDPKLRDKWEDELNAAIEAEYRRQRTDLLAGVQLWLRDIWLHTLGIAGGLPRFQQSAAASDAARLSPAEATANLQIIEQTQRLLFSNVQEALALEVGLLKLKL